MMILCYELQSDPTILHAITAAIMLVICWMIWVTAFMREALVMDFMRALYSVCSTP